MQMLQDPEVKNKQYTPSTSPRRLSLLWQTRLYKGDVSVWRRQHLTNEVEESSSSNPAIPPFPSTVAENTNGLSNIYVTKVTRKHYFMLSASCSSFTCRVDVWQLIKQCPCASTLTSTRVSSALRPSHHLAFSDTQLTTFCSTWILSISCTSQLMGCWTTQKQSDKKTCTSM